MKLSRSTLAQSKPPPSLKNPTVDPQKPHSPAKPLQCTHERVQSMTGPLLMLHGTTKISYGSNEGDIGLLSRVARKTIYGILMHSSLVVTSEGLPLSIAAVKFWTRDKFKGTNVLKCQINPARVPIEQKESIRWPQNVQHVYRILLNPRDRCIHVGDRESDTSSEIPGIPGISLDDRGTSRRLSATSLEAVSDSTNVKSSC